MKRFFGEFLRRGIISCGIGPIVLAAVYLVLQRSADLTILTVSDVCIGIFSLTALAFVAGGMNAIYRIERLPLMIAISIHGTVLYVSYLITYLLNDWLDLGLIPIIVFSVIFVVGFILIWAIIYLIIRKNIATVNEKLRQSRGNA